MSLELNGGNLLTMDTARRRDCHAREKVTRDVKRASNHVVAAGPVRGDVRGCPDPVAGGLSGTAPDATVTAFPSGSGFDAWRPIHFRARGPLQSPWRGSTRGLWDDAGDRLGKYEYTPFGGKYADAGADITRKFTGHDWDSEARLYYTAYRYYSPDANRWLTRDPLGMVDGPNVYAYVKGNPVSMWDADGRIAWLVAGCLLV